MKKDESAYSEPTDPSEEDATEQVIEELETGGLDLPTPDGTGVPFGADNDD